MAQQRKRTRVYCKIEDLPPDIRQEFEAQLSDMRNSFVGISKWLATKGHKISKSAICRYSNRTSETARRINESMQKTQAILEAVERNPDMDMSKAAQALLADGLMQRMATADEEFLEMPLEDAGRLLAALRRVDIADKKLKLEQRKRIDLAFEGLEEQLMASIKATPELAERLRQLLVEAKAAIISDDNR